MTQPAYAIHQPTGDAVRHRHGGNGASSVDLRRPLSHHMVAAIRGRRTEQLLWWFLTIAAFAAVLLIVAMPPRPAFGAAPVSSRYAMDGALPASTASRTFLPK